MVQHTGTSNDLPDQWVADSPAEHRRGDLLAGRAWLPGARGCCWLVSIVALVGAVGGPGRRCHRQVQHLFYSDPRRGCRTVLITMCSPRRWHRVLKLASAAIAGCAQVVGKGRPRSWHARNGRHSVAVSGGNRGLADSAARHSSCSEKVRQGARRARTWNGGNTWPRWGVPRHPDTRCEQNRRTVVDVRGRQTCIPLWTQTTCRSQPRSGDTTVNLLGLPPTDCRHRPAGGRGREGANIRSVVTSTPVVPRDSLPGRASVAR